MAFIYFVYQPNQYKCGEGKGFGRLVHGKHMADGFVKIAESVRCACLDKRFIKQGSEFVVGVPVYAYGRAAEKTGGIAAVTYHNDVVHYKQRHKQQHRYHEQ